MFQPTKVHRDPPRKPNSYDLTGGRRPGTQIESERLPQAVADETPAGV